MAHPAKCKDRPLSIRLPEADIAMIDRAAGLRGQSRTDFVRDAVVRAAKEVFTEHRLIWLNAEDSEAFVAILANPGKPSRALVELMRTPAPWELPDQAD